MPQPRKKQLVLALNKIQNECQFSMLFVLDSVIGLQLKQFEEQIIFPQLVSQRRGHLQMDLDNSLKKVFSIKPKLRISHSLYCCSQTFPNAYASNVLDFLYYYYYYFFLAPSYSALQIEVCRAYLPLCFVSVFVRNVCQVGSVLTLETYFNLR